MDLTISTGAIITILSILGGGGVVGLISKIYALKKQLDDKRDEKACVICRGEVDTRLQNIKDQMAAKGDVLAHASLLAQHSTELEVLKTKLDTLNQSSHRVEELLGQLLNKKD